ncbi:PIR protein, putative [Plasmodium sp.]|nr:PIR protein, putative [Plasmodium sp.]
MKVNYINILLFAFPLNILANNHKKSSITPRHIQTTRLLCECELYMSNYDNDPEMKWVMQQFHDRTTQRFQEYDEKLQGKRQICKDKCDKEIQKIILKDKIEKELTEKFSALHTDIQSDGIPTCICEKPLADKVEKGCFRCGSILDAAMPELGAMGATALYALNAWKPTAISTAIEEALKLGAAKILDAGIKAGEAIGTKTVTAELKALGVLELCPEISKSFFIKTSYANASKIINTINVKYNATCELLDSSLNVSTACKKFNIKFGIHISEFDTYGTPATQAIPTKVGQAVEVAKEAAANASKVASERVTAAITRNQTALLEAEFNSSITSIYASIIAIVVIVLIMLIIYLILRYRRKKK